MDALTKKVGEILALVEKDRRPGSERLHSALDELKAILITAEEEIIFSDDLLTAWNYFTGFPQPAATVSQLPSLPCIQ